MNFVLERVPDAGRLSLKALGTLRRKPPRELVLPDMSTEVREFRFDAGNLEAYRKICGYAEGGGVPMPYPQVSAIGMQMYLLTREQFPLPLLGLVHLKNRIEQTAALAPDGTYAVKVSVAESHATERGLEFDIETVYAATDGSIPWKSVATVLYRRKVADAAPKKKGPPPADASAGLSGYLAFDAPADIGRRYGKIAGDNNPIHLYPLTARLFGFERHIAHGMWSLARCDALLQEQLGRAPRQLTVQFRQPLFLPGRVALRFARDDQGMAFGLLGRDSGKTHLTGNLR